MSAETKKRIPSPLLAAAGAGDLAYEKLRTLPEKMSGLRAKVNELRPTGKIPLPERRDMRADLARLREVAKRNAEVVVHTAQVAQERATVVYKDLVARGEQVVRPERTERPADAEAEQTAELTPAVALEIEPAAQASAGTEAPGEGAESKTPSAGEAE